MTTNACHPGLVPGPVVFVMLSNAKHPVQNVTGFFLPAVVRMT